MTLLDDLETAARWADDADSPTHDPAFAARLRDAAERLRYALTFHGSGPGEFDWIAGWRESAKHVNGGPLKRPTEER